MDNVLEIRTLGGFSVTWNNKLIAGGSKYAATQSVTLLQILLHNKEQGVPRDKLEELLFGDRDMDNTHHALQSVIYNTKNKLLKAGLPGGTLIEQRQGIFYWTDELPIHEDATELRRLHSLASQERDPDRRLTLFLQAVYLYGGDFLPSQAASIWAAQEARKLKAIFCECAENAAQLLRMNQDYYQLEGLGTYAAKVDPLADWECLTMEALAQMGRYEEARKLYEDTVSYYFNEQGLRPSKRLMESFSSLAARMNHEHASLDEIQAELTGLTSPEPGGYLCSYPVFVGVYRMVERMLERGGQSVYLMLCTVVDGKGNPVREGPTLDELSKRMGDAVRRAIRRGDALCQYGRGQYLALLVNTTRENCALIQKRINRNFIIGRQRASIEYYVNAMFWEKKE